MLVRSFRKAELRRSPAGDGTSGGRGAREGGGGVQGGDRQVHDRLGEVTHGVRTELGVQFFGGAALFRRRQHERAPADMLQFLADLIERSGAEYHAVRQRIIYKTHEKLPLVK